MDMAAESEKELVQLQKRLAEKKVEIRWRNFQGNLMNTIFIPIPIF